MRILNKLVSVVLCLVLLSNIAITALAEEPTNNVKDLITYCVPVISNEYTDKTVVFYEYQGKYYLDIEDIKNFTRSTVSETDSKIVITHGIRELEIDKSTGHLIDSTVYDQGTIPFLAYEGKYLCEGIPMLMYLGAACTIRDEVALEVLMPSITIWESIMPDYLDYYFNITELYGGEDNVKISLICDILSDVLDGVSGHGLFADGDTHLEDALFEILEVDMMKYTSVREAVATKNQDINDFLSSDAVGTLLEGGSNATDTVSEVLDYYSDFYLETEILKNNIRWQHSYNVGDIDSASKLSKQINSQVYEQSSIKAYLGTYENLADVLDLGMIAFDTAVTSYGLMQYDNDIKNLFARTINDEMFNYVGYNEISWTNVSNRISNKLSSNEAIVASTAVENLTEYVAGELVEGGTAQALSAFTSKANIYVAAAQIATFVSSLINKDLHEAYSADMNAIWLSAVQYDIARLTTQVLLKAGEEEKFSNVASIEKLKDMLALYYRTTIAFSENIAVSIDEFGNKNKDEWVKYFSSTTDASVANYAAQYLYRITNCTIVPIIKYVGLNDSLLDSEWMENYVSSDKLSYEMREEYFESKTSTGILFLTNKISYPYFLGSSEVEKKINARYEEIINNYRESSSEDIESWYETVVEYDELYKLPFYNNMEITVSYNENGYVSLLEWVHDWPGGMHPYHYENGITYDIETAQEVDYSRFFIGNDEEIKSLLNKKASDLGYSKYYQDKWYENSQFVLTTDGICFYFWVGDAVARQEIVVPYSEGEEPFVYINPQQNKVPATKDSALSKEEIKELFIKANNLYDGWLCHGWAPELDKNNIITINGNQYAYITSSDFNSVSSLKNELKKYFSEEIYRDYIGHYYIMEDGKMYGLVELGQGGDMHPNKLSLTINSMSEKECSFTVTSYYNQGDSYSNDYKIKLINGNWIFVENFVENLGLYFNNDMQWLS